MERINGVFKEESFFSEPSFIRSMPSRSNFSLVALLAVARDLCPMNTDSASPPPMT